MTPRRQRMIADRHLRGLSERTQEMSVRAVRQLADHDHKSPDRITEEERRDSCLYLKNVTHYSRSASPIALCGRKFFYEHTWQRAWTTLTFVRPPRDKTLPVILRIEEVRAILAHLKLPRDRVCLTTIDACGLRLQDGPHLQVTDIDAARMRIHVRHGKGAKDRYGPLPPRTWPLLRSSWGTPRHPVWIFPAPDRAGTGLSTATQPMPSSSVQDAVRAALKARGIPKRASVHPLRHAWATPLLAARVHLRLIQAALGHSSPPTTALYTHLTLQAHEMAAASITRLMEDLSWERWPRSSAALGGHVSDCDHCDAYQDSDHAWKNRHCPKGQNGSANAWLQRPKDLLLPVPSCLVTCTLPDSRRELARSHQKLFYNRLFRSSAQALQALALAPRVVGGKLGLVGGLHPWTRALPSHPHGHYLVPAGGLAADGRQWRPAREHFLVPVQARSILCRANVRDALRKPPGFDLVPAAVWAQDWVVHGAPVGRGSQALPYLPPDIFRVALSHNRILQLADGQVTFQDRDAQTGAIQVCTVTAEECIRRFLPHVLPDHFVKVRYDGLCGPGTRDARKKARQLLGVERRNGHAAGPAPASPPPATAMRCPKCASVMPRIEPLRPNGWFPLTPGP